MANFLFSGAGGRGVGVGVILSLSLRVNVNGILSVSNNLQYCTFSPDTLVECHDFPTSGYEKTTLCTVFK